MIQKIPKIIHYCWLSDDPFPQDIERCMASWKKWLPDYEFMLWNTHTFPMTESVWVQQAFEQKKYAFASDYIRLYAVYHHGGIYMDTDVEVVRSFDDLLHLPYMIGTEGGGWIEAGVFGAVKNTDWLKSCLDYFNKPFIKADGSLDMVTLPQVMNGIVSKDYTLKIADRNTIENKIAADKEHTIYLFEKDFFCAKNMGTGVITKTANTYTIHHFAMSWIAPAHRYLPDLKRKLIKIFGERWIMAVVKMISK